MEKHRAIAEGVFALVNAHDLGGLSNLMAADCVYRIPGMPELTGLGAFTSFVKGWLAAFPDLKHEIVRYAEQGDTAAWELRVTGTHTGTMQTPNGPLPATGRRVTLEAADVVRFRDGKAVAWHVYFDQLAVLQQLGLAAV